MWSCVLLADAVGTDDAADLNHFAAVAASDQIAAIDAIGRSASGYVLMGAPRALAGALATSAAVAAGRFPEIRIATIVTDHAPIALFSAMVVARSVTPHPPQGIALAQSLLQNSWSGAWARSVAKLEHPTPRLGQHLRSLLPGEGFMIRNLPSPAVLSHVGPTDVPPVGMDRVMLIEDSGMPATAVRRLGELPGVSSMRQIKIPGSWVSVYGTDRVAQLVLAPADPRPLLSPVSLRCPACELEQAAAVCPFCHVVVRPEPAALRTGQSA